jgi:predicted RNase H-like nuclease
MRGPVRGAQLPYRLLAGVVPCPGGWLAATAKVQGVTIVPEEPHVFQRFIDVLDYKPAYQVIGLFAPVGLLDDVVPKGRTCERDARKLLGLPRASAIASAPPRAALAATTYADAAVASGGHLNPVCWRQMAKIAEVDAAIAPYWQRSVFEVHPELTFYQLGEDRPVRYSKHTGAGRVERRALLAGRLPGVERILEAQLARVSEAHLLDAAACLWTARRILSRGINRLPEDPEWDSLGLRMEIVR